MDINRIEPFIRNCLRGKSDRKMKQQLICYDSTLYYIIGGKGDAYIDDVAYSLSTGALVFIPSGTKHTVTCRDELDPLFFFKISFDFTYTSANYSDPISPTHVQSYDEMKLTEHFSVGYFTEPKVMLHMDTLADRMHLFFNEYASRKELLGAQGRLSAILKEILIIVARTSTFNIDRKNNLARDVISYIDTHIEEPLNNNSIASVFGYHPYYLTRVLRDEIGMTPHKYLMLKRCEAAKNLLVSSDHTIDVIAQMAGFTSQSHFAAAFRSMTGMSPTEFRRRSVSCENDVQHDADSFASADIP
jgi:AraC-like DNA-binding protein